MAVGGRVWNSAADGGLLGPPDEPGSPAAIRPARERRGRLRLLLTFGSGLRKLDELRHLLGPGVSLRRSALLTLAGLLLFTLSVLGIVVKVTGPDPDTTVGVLVLYAIIGGVLLVAGLADLIADPSHGELKRWIGILKRTGVRWRDHAASADPVPNGALLDEHGPFPKHVTVHDHESLLRDHTTYWTNRDEFVTEVVRRLAELDPLVAPDLAGHDGDFEFVPPPALARGMADGHPLGSGRRHHGCSGPQVGAVAAVGGPGSRPPWRPFVAGAVPMILALLGPLAWVQNRRRSSGRRAQPTSDGPPSR
jgi:hypothetical protein